MSKRRDTAIYGFWGVLWRLVIAGAVVFALAGTGGYFAAEYLIRRPEAPAPNLLSLSVEEALRQASAKGFSLRIEQEEVTNLLDDDHVLAQQPSPGTIVKEGTTLRVTLAANP